jgi:hypothetical protein
MMSKQLIKISVIAIGALVLLVLALYLMKKDQDRPGKRNSVETIGEAIADKTLTTKSEAYAAYANEKDEFYRRSTASFAPPPAVSKKSEPEKAVVASATPVVENRAQEIQFDAAYEEISRNVRSIYEEAPDNMLTTVREQPEVQPQMQMPATDELPAPAETPEERRRRAMRQNWGMGSPSEAARSDSARPAMFRAVIHGTQIVRSGQTALFRTKEPICYGSITIPENTLLAGYANISESRLTISINSVRLGHGVFALPLEVYGSDGIAGIPLDYDEVGKITNSESTSSVLQETSAAMSSYGGTIGRVVGSVVSGVGNQVRSAKNAEVKLIDNQTVILKIVEK